MALNARRDIAAGETISNDFRAAVEQVLSGRPCEARPAHARKFSGSSFHA
jgi:hypothetical protein